MIKAVIVDFYGVIYSNFNWPVVDERIYSDAQRAKKFSHLKYLSNRGKISNEEFRQKSALLAQDNKNPSKPAVLVSPRVNVELLGLIKNVFPGVKVALLSNGNKRDVMAQLRTCGIKEQFDLIVTSSDMRYSKPEKGAYLEVFKRLGVEPKEAVLIDDSPRHAAETSKFGYNTIRFVDNTSAINDLENFVE